MTGHLRSIVALALATSYCHAQPPPTSPAADRQSRGYLTANGLLQRGLFEEAATEYRQFLAAHPDHEKARHARYGLAVCLFRTGKLPESLAELAPIIDDRKFEFAAEVALMAGQCRAAAGRQDDAARMLSRVVADHPKHDLADDAYAGWIDALYRQKKFADAARQADALAANWPDSPMLERAQYLAALSYVSLGDDSAAIVKLKQWLDRWPSGALARQATLQLAQCEQRGKSPNDAANRYRAILATRDNQLRPAALYGLATLLIADNKPTDAAPLLDELLKRYSAHALASAARVERARLWLDAGKPDRAADLLNTVATDDAEWGDDRAYWLAKCRLRAGDSQSAAEQLREAMTQFPRSALRPEMCYDRAVALVMAGDDEAAIAALAEFIKSFATHGNMPNALHMLASAQHRRRQFDACEAACTAFGQQYASHALAGAVAFLSVENAFVAGKFDKAIIACRAFLQSHAADPQAAFVRHRLGLALQRGGKTAEAETELTSALEQLAAMPDSQAKTMVCRATTRALGDIAFEREKWSAAAQWFTRCLADFKNEQGNPAAAGVDDIYLRLAISQQRDGKHKQALGTLEKLIADFPDSPHVLHARFEQGQVLIALERYDDAEKVLQQVTRAADNERFLQPAVQHLASIAMRRGDFGSAATQFGEVAGRTSDKTLAITLLMDQGNALLSAKQFAEAESVFARVIADSPGAPVVPAAKAQCGISLARQDKSKQALSVFARLTPAEWSGLDAALRAAARYDRAACLRKTGKLEEAVADLRAISDDPAAGALRWHACGELAGIHFDAKKYEDAARLLHALRQSPDAATMPDDLREAVLYRLAVCEFETGHADSAAALFDEFRKTFKTSTLAASAAYFHGELLVRGGKHAEAVAALSAALKAQPADDIRAACLLRLGESHAALQRWEKSARAYADYLERYADREQWFTARFGVGWAMENLGRAEDAITAYRDVIDRHKGPTAARAQFQVGECLFVQGKYEDASRELLKVDILYGYPEWSAAALFEAGRCFEKLNKQAEARAQYKLVTDKHKATRWADLAATRLSELARGAVPGRN